ncbi:DUF6265 family protein [Pedobacter sp. JY14-1]|uniref:DUF6265 family protein n=1 Tax=Pedobacter sp. JY14-1 TaxID=3034151 RepID=UPI0023E1F090|nr:DUF6265 family protein [Pedobacter sp. JY14-1]
MKYLFSFFALLLLNSICFSAHAQTAGGSFSDIAFIEGHWKAKMPDGQTIEGTWLAPEGDNILGFMRMMRGGKADLYEILAYEKSEKGLVSLVKHFKPGLIGLEEKEKQDRYVFVEAGKDRAIFQKEGESLRILYEKRSATQFVIARGNEQDGKWVFKDLFVFNKVK